MSRDLCSEGERPLWRRLLFNRFVVVPGTIGIAALAWIGDVSLHNGELTEDRVIDGL